mmetsp:Transcript_75084/g.118634  ORF Transcript_75084/g.118634 Transcript_75084/m.118634 type:complete len:227 (+) Transcript_75084:190-870(+)
MEGHLHTSTSGSLFGPRVHEVRKQSQVVFGHTLPWKATITSDIYMRLHDATTWSALCLLDDVSLSCAKGSVKLRASRLCGRYLYAAEGMQLRTFALQYRCEAVRTPIGQGVHKLVDNCLLDLYLQFLGLLSLLIAIVFLGHRALRRLRWRRRRRWRDEERDGSLHCRLPWRVLRHCFPARCIFRQLNRLLSEVGCITDNRYKQDSGNSGAYTLHYRREDIPCSGYS